MNGINGHLKLYIIERHGEPLILTPSIGGLPEPYEPTYPVLRVSYLSPESVGSAEGLAGARSEISGDHALLLMTMPCADGPPYRSGVVFRRHQTLEINWRYGNRGMPQTPASEYLAAVTLSQYSWGSDLMRGKPGYFLSGPLDADTLWRIVRVEFDAARRQLFTLSPVRLASGLPEVDFSPIANDLLRQKLAADWSEVQRCVAGNLYSSLITASKNVAESLALCALGAQAGKMSLDKSLGEISKRLTNKQPLDLPIEFLHYHLMSKLRILHGHTHSDRVVISGRLVEPDFALTVVEDLVQVLKATGLAR